MKTKRAIKQETVRLWPDAGQMLGYGKTTTYRKEAMGEIPTLPISGKKLVPMAWLERVLGGDAAK